MKINRLKSTTFKRICSIALSGGIMLGSGITLYKKISMEEYQHYYHQTKEKYIQMVNNPDMALFDNKFVDYCQNGIIKCGSKEYSINDIYIIYGQLNENDIVYLQSYKEPKLDLLSNSEVDSSYKRKKIMLLKYSNVFYDYYKSHKDSIDKTIIVDDEFKDYIFKFVGSINNELPDTYYYEKLR